MRTMVWLIAAFKCIDYARDPDSTPGFPFAIIIAALPGCVILDLHELRTLFH